MILLLVYYPLAAPGYCLDTSLLSIEQENTNSENGDIDSAVVKKWLSELTKLKWATTSPELGMASESDVLHSIDGSGLIRGLPQLPELTPSLSLPAFAKRLHDWEKRHEV